MIKYLILSTTTFLLGACTTTEIPEKGIFLVKATPKSSERTSWYRDFCTFNQPVDDKITPLSCALHHPYIGKYRLSNVKNVEGALYATNLYSGTSGGLRVFSLNNKESNYYLLQKAPKDLQKSTDIEFFHNEVTYNKKKNCLSYVGAYPHLDIRNCPNKKFHEQAFEKCIPLNEVIEHFN